MVKSVCKKELCPKPHECPQYHTLKKEEVNGVCCPLFVCEPPEDKCIFETAYTNDAKGGEKQLTKCVSSFLNFDVSNKIYCRYEKQKVLKSANDSWQDGPCRECQCVLTSIGMFKVLYSENLN